MKQLEDLKWNEQGLIPAIVQEYSSREVLMLAYMNEESLQKTLETGETWFFSRSRQALWHKGETSGHIQKVKNIRYDCDADTLLVEVLQTGAACHTGQPTCFYQTLQSNLAPDELNPNMIPDLVHIIKDRRQHPKEGSYTNYLFDKGIDKMLKKVGEESAEVIIAAKNPDKGELIYEISDLVYHTLVLMEQRDVTVAEIKKELTRRFHKE
jgi:phosphoribosyl-ATP pyrophosphohydrolase/phosphoribosyl-AMP cyclohydrolase